MSSHIPPWYALQKLTWPITQRPKVRVTWFTGTKEMFNQGGNQMKGTGQTVSKCATKVDKWKDEVLNKWMDRYWIKGYHLSFADL